MMGTLMELLAGVAISGALFYLLGYIPDKWEDDFENDQEAR